MQENDNYYPNNIYKCPDSVRFSGKEKYPNKVMVWVAISNRGISKLLFRPSKSIRTSIRFFIREHHPDSNYIFWPDLDGCHYSKQTVAWMDETHRP